MCNIGQLGTLFAVSKRKMTKYLPLEFRLLTNFLGMTYMCVIESGTS